MKLTESDELLKLANDLRIACQIISRRVRFEGTRNLAPHLMSVLGRVRNQPVSVSELSASERVSAPSMTRTVNCLAKRGLVAKTPHPTDGRQVLIEITNDGIEAIDRAIADRDCWMVGLLEGLEPDQLARLYELVPLLSEVANS